MYLGLDLGTSGMKALLIDADQKPVASASAALSVSRPFYGWSEQDPTHWIDATKDALGQLKNSHPKELAAVSGIGFSGQMHGATLLGSDDAVLRPCMLWNDTRSHQEADALDDNPLFRSVSGNIVFPGFTAPKVLWVKNNEPKTFEKIAKVLLPKDYLRLWLTGEHVSEMSDAAGTSWLDVGNRRWSDELLTASSMCAEQMPSLVEGTEVSGKLRRALADEWGMGANVVVAGGAGDNAASAVGMGTVASGSAFVSLGTSGVLFAANDRYLPNPESAVHAFCHALPDTWHQMGVILSATDALNWLCELTGRTAEELTAPATDDLLPPSDVTFLPYLSGERTPHNDANARGVLTGLNHGSDPQVLGRAVMEGVAFAFRDNLEALKAAGTNIERATAVGGGSRSRYWLKAISTALDIEIDIPEEEDFGAALGAARLGLIAAESAKPLDICSAPTTSRTIRPEADLRAAYEDAYARYCALYPAIKNLQN